MSSKGHKMIRYALAHNLRLPTWARKEIKDMDPQHKMDFNVKLDAAERRRRHAEAEK